MHLERDIGELRHHLVLGEVVEVAAVLLAGRVLGQLGRERCEVLVLLDALHRRLGARLRLGLRLFVLRVGPEQDVAGAHFLGRAHRLDLLVIDLAQRFVGHQRPRVVLQHQTHQELAARKNASRFLKSSESWSFRASAACAASMTSAT